MYNSQDENVDLERDYLPSCHSSRFRQLKNPEEAVLEHFVQLITNQTSELCSNANIKVLPNLRYGGQVDRQLVDIYYSDVAKSKNKATPLFVFIHGGYWQMLDKSSSGSMVAPLVERGYRVAIMDYNLCPQVTLSQLLEQFSNFLEWIFDYAASTHTSHISFAGHSAGAHLLAQLLNAPDVLRSPQRACVPIRSLFYISGVYDLRELWPLTSVNPKNILSLNAELAAKLSPILWEYVEPSPEPTFGIHVLVAGHDSVSFIEQSRSFARLLAAKGFKIKFHIFEQYDHFDIIEESAIEGTPISEYIKEALQ
ncbi:kynurenine formamidase [Scaptodrosophila lebanonensis]|uniref:Kynurenine formamidase n=1 Tax=Drosophila lebanonensis TaxID=7225 RepID=A0A6J2TQ02_DROLE|nr:kynurenine formamidase [Scaptodrosophila lebanonensis]